MNQVVANHSSPQFRHLPLVGLLLLFLLLTACFGGGDDPAPEAAAPEAAAATTISLVCNETCMGQGQCGTAADGRTVILGHSGQPSTHIHDTLHNNNSVVTIVGEQPRTIADGSGAQSALTFYAVHLATGGPTSWVAGSCVNRSAQQ